MNKIKCDNCEIEFSLNAVKINKTKIVLNNTPVHLVYFVCPKCNKIYRISIQDAKYYDLKKDLEKIKKKIQKNQGSNNLELARQLNDMANKKHKRLSDHVEVVNRMFPGEFIFEVSKGKLNKKVIKYLP